MPPLRRGSRTGLKGIGPLTVGAFRDSDTAPAVAPGPPDAFVNLLREVCMTTDLQQEALATLPLSLLLLDPPPVGLGGTFLDPDLLPQAAKRRANDEEDEDEGEDEADEEEDESDEEEEDADEEEDEDLEDEDADEDFDEDEDEDEEDEEPDGEEG